MFINCPHCAALLATDPATDLPPERCPRCAARLREPVQGKASPPDEVTIVAIPDEPGHGLPPAPAIAAAVPADADAPSEAGAPATEVAEPEAHPPPEQAPEAGTGVGAPTDDDAETPAAPPVDASAVEPAEKTMIDASAIVAEDPAPLDASAVELAERAMIDASAVVAEDPAPPGSDEIATDAAASDDAVAMSEDAADIALPASDGPPPPQPASAVPTVMPRRDKPAPSFARTRQRTVVANARRRWALPSVIAGLSLLLALQWVLADRARLAADARWRPFVAQLCGMLRCSLPPWREPSAFALLERDVRAHPTVAGALRVTATFRNDAQWPQPWPDMVLTLSDVDGHAVGARTFVADEYLGARPTQNVLSSGQSATIRMDVLEPAPRIVAFAFDFH